MKCQLEEGSTKELFTGAVGGLREDSEGKTGVLVMITVAAQVSIKKGNEHMGLKTVRAAWIPLSAEELPEQGSQAELYSERGENVRARTLPSQGCTITTHTP